MAEDSNHGGGGSSSGNNNMVVAVRIRPLSPKEEAQGCEACCKVAGGKQVIISKAGIAGRYLRSQQGSVNEYAFDVAFGEDSTQSEVYEGTAKNHVKSVLDGYNVTCFAYGATGAGKTHTMMGSERTGEANGEEEERVTGIIPQSLVDIFTEVERRRANKASKYDTWRVSVSYLEVYNEQIYDLIEPSRQQLAVREDAAKGVVQVAGLTEVVVQSTGEVLDLLRRGNRNRKTESTAANVVSSRSHAVLQVCVRFTTTDNTGNDLVRDSKLSLIDLAGSERASATQNRGLRMQEGANINKSLLALANCINALAENGTSGMRRNVKYRDSKLTHLLKTSLEGECRLIMIANINPSCMVFEDSHNTLKYANRAKNIKVKPGIHLQRQEVPWHEREGRLMADNDRLRHELAQIKQLLSSRGIEGAEIIAAATEQALDTSVSNSSFLSTCSTLEVGDDDNSMMIDAPDPENTMVAAHSHSQQGHGSYHNNSNKRRKSTMPQPLAHHAPISSFTDHQQNGKTTSEDARVHELQNVIEEMKRTRESMAQLVETLRAQLREREAELQGQKQVNHNLERDLQATQDKLHKTRELNVHLQTRLEQYEAVHGPVSEAVKGGASSGNEKPQAAGETSSGPTVSTAKKDEASLQAWSIMSPIKAFNDDQVHPPVMQSPTYGRRTRSSMRGPGAGTKRRSMIPRPNFATNTQPPSAMKRTFQPMDVDEDEILSPKKKHKMVTTTENEKENARPWRMGTTPMRTGTTTTNTVKDLANIKARINQLSSKKVATMGVAQRTRSRTSLPPLGETLNF